MRIVFHGCDSCPTSRDHCAAEYHGCQLDAPPAMFDRAELIGEGKQASLDIAVDETAVRGKYEMPPEKPKQPKGQGGFVFGGWINNPEYAEEES